MKKIIQQFISYFFVGGISAIVEWIFFALFANFVELNYLFARACGRKVGLCNA